MRWQQKVRLQGRAAQMSDMYYMLLICNKQGWSCHMRSEKDTITGVQLVGMCAQQLQQY